MKQIEKKYSNVKLTCSIHFIEEHNFPDLIFLLEVDLPPGQAALVGIPRCQGVGTGTMTIGSVWIVLAINSQRGVVVLICTTLVSCGQSIPEVSCVTEFSSSSSSGKSFFYRTKAYLGTEHLATWKCNLICTCLHLQYATERMVLIYLC